MLAQGGDPLEPPMACGPCDFVAGALAVLARGATPGTRWPAAPFLRHGALALLARDYPSDIRWQSQARDSGYR